MADSALTNAAPNAASSAKGQPPLSPHLQIWRFTVTMAASITHRATGVALYTGSIVLALWLFLAAQGPAAFYHLGGFLSSPFGAIILAGYVWALCFHMLGGLRYLYFDSGRGLAPATAAKTAWAVYLGATLLAALILFAGFSARGGA